MRNTSSAVIQRERSGSLARCAIATARIASCSTRLSLALEPSVPTASGTPRRSISGARASPVPMRLLLSGLSTAVALRAAMMSMSSSVSQMLCAHDQRLDSTPRSAR